MRAIRFLAGHWHDIANCVTDHSPMDTRFARHPGDRSFSKLALSADVLEKLHLRPPIQNATSILQLHPE
jgi:hypothetical protein